MKKKINTREIVREKWTQIFATDFSFMFPFTRDLVTKREIRKGQQGRSFLFSIILIGTVQIYWFKLITSR